MKQFFTLLASLLLTLNTNAQVGIGTASPDASAALDITSTTRGLLFPRMTTAELEVISSPAEGLVVFDTDTAFFMVYNGSGWTNLLQQDIDITAPALAEVTAIATPSNNTTPSYVFTTDEAGTITTSITEGFSTSTSAATGSNQTITFNTLNEGSYLSETITVTDAAGNASSITIPNFVIDTTSPTISAIATGDLSWGEVLNATDDNTEGTVSVTTSGVEDGQTVTITLNSATYTGLVSNNSSVDPFSGNIITENGATVTISSAGLQALTDGQSYTLTADVSDVVGNAAAQVTSANFSVDTTAPTMTITSSTSGVTDGSSTSDSSIELTFTSSESTTNFDVNDIIVTNGTLSSFTGSGTAYTVTFTPTAEGATTIDVAAGTFTDTAGNNNDAATQFNWTYEATSTPTLGTPWTVALGGNKDVAAVLVSGNYAYVSKHIAGITMVDISDPTNPFVVSTFSNGNTNAHMYIYTVGSNEYLITNNWVSGINVFNVTDKSNITLHTSFSLSSYDGGRVTDVAIDGTNLYASIRNDGLVSMDLTSLESTGISVLDHEDLGGDDGDASRGVAIKGNYAIVTKEGAGVAIIDISNPANLGSPSYVSTTGSAEKDIVVSGNYAYVANNESGVAIIDISNPANPGTPVYTPGSFTNTYGIAINGNYLIISDQTDDTLGIIDISDPTNPGSASYVGSGSTELQRVASSGNYVYFAADKNLGISLISN